MVARGTPTTNLTLSNRGWPTRVPAARRVRCPGMSAPAAGAVVLLAHQGGWDELAFVALPILLFAGLLVIANRRATRAQAERAGEPDHPSSDQ